MNEIVRRHVCLIARRLVVGHGDANVVGGIEPQFLANVVNNGFDRMAGIEYVVHDEQRVGVGQIFDKVAQAVDRDLTAAFIDASVGAGANRDVVCIDPLVGEIFLNSDTYWRATAPDRDNERWPEAAVIYIRRQLKGVFQQALGV